MIASQALSIFMLAVSRFCHEWTDYSLFNSCVSRKTLWARSSFEMRYSTRVCPPLVCLYTPCVVLV